MAQAEAAQPTELQPSSDTGQNLLPEGHEVAELFRDTFNTVSSIWADITGNKPDTVANAASLVVNGKAPFETVSGQLTDLSKQGKLNDLSTYFDNHYSIGLRDQLAQNYPGREAEIDKILGAGTADKPDPMLGGLSREQLKSVFDNGTFVGVGTAGPVTKLDVRGGVTFHRGQAEFGQPRDLRHRPQGVTGPRERLAGPAGERARRRSTTRRSGWFGRAATRFRTGSRCGRSSASTCGSRPRPRPWPMRSIRCTKHAKPNCSCNCYSTRTRTLF